ncbi:MAG: hypothetical protein GX647_08305 [Clostridiales bacterium]|jgi:uridine kinase|nr:hypothetical protein [Clostridiales bacterium]
MREIFLQERAAHPLAEARDFLKLLYQSEFGGGHMATDAEESLGRLTAEWASCQVAEIGPEDAFSPVGGGLVRLNLRPAMALGLRPETVHGLFTDAANRPRGSAAGLEKPLVLLRSLAGELGLDAGELDGEIMEWRGAGFPALGHSDAYRRAYRPAYRLVGEAAERFLPLFQAIDAHILSHGRAVVAIDGDSGSGKSTLGALVAAVYGGNLYHMDDFFLPPERKTPERLAEPGGNVDWERFKGEIADRLGAPLRYRPYSCRAGSLGAEARTSPTAVEVVEGVYSLHPALRHAYGIKVFLAAAPEFQRRRIRERSGERMLSRFVNEWIPLEKLYFDRLDVRNCCDLVFEMS